MASARRFTRSSLTPFVSSPRSCSISFSSTTLSFFNSVAVSIVAVLLLIPGLRGVQSVRALVWPASGTRVDAADSA